MFLLWNATISTKWMDNNEWINIHSLVSIGLTYVNLHLLFQALYTSWLRWSSTLYTAGHVTPSTSEGVAKDDSVAQLSL